MSSQLEGPCKLLPLPALALGPAAAPSQRRCSTAAPLSADRRPASWLARLLTHPVPLPSRPIRSADADFSCFADLALTSPVDYYREGQGSLMQVKRAVAAGRVVARGGSGGRASAAPNRD